MIRHAFSNYFGVWLIDILMSLHMGEPAINNSEEINVTFNKSHILVTKITVWNHDILINI